MPTSLPNCWEIWNCGRQKGGPKVAELGECPASQRSLGHSCWAVAGTLCGGTVQGSFAEKQGNCMACEVFKTYNRQTGSQGAMVEAEFPEENSEYRALLRGRLRSRSGQV